MKKIKSRISLCLLLILCIVSIPVISTRAEGNNFSSVQYGGTGQYLYIDVLLDTQDGVGAYQGVLQYDTTMISYVKYEIGVEFQNTLTDVNESEKGQINIGMASGKDIIANGRLVRLYFELCSDENDITNINYEDKVFCSTSGQSYECQKSTYGIGLSGARMWMELSTNQSFYYAGDELYLNFNLYNNKGFSAYQGTLTYDSSKMTYQSYSLDTGSVNALADIYDDGEGTITIAIASDRDITKSGQILQLKFDVKGGTEGYPAFLNHIGQMINENLEEYVFSDQQIYTQIIYKDAANVFTVEAPQSVTEGEEFEAYLKLENNTGFGALDLALEYDSDYLEVVSVEVADVLKSALISTKTTDGKIVVGAISGTDITDDGNLIKITFQSKKEKTGTTKLDLNINSLVNEKLETLKYTIGNANVSIKSAYILGDANRDGKVNIKDSALVRRYAAGWKVDIDEDASDVNGDGKINIKDSALIRRYAAGWKVEFTQK